MPDISSVGKTLWMAFLISVNELSPESFTKRNTGFLWCSDRLKRKSIKSDPETRPLGISPFSKKGRYAPIPSTVEKSALLRVCRNAASFWATMMRSGFIVTA